jgi:hypothetical protein
MFYLHIRMDLMVFEIAIADVLLFAFACRLFVVHGKLYRIFPEKNFDQRFGLLIPFGQTRKLCVLSLPL